MDILNTIIIPVLGPIAQNALYDCSKHVFQKHIRSTKDRNLKRVILESVNSVSELDDRTRDSISDSIYKCCSRIEKADICDIVSTELSQSGIHDHNPENIAAKIYINMIRSIERIPDLRDRVSYVEIFNIRYILESHLRKSDSDYQMIQRELSKMSNNLNQMMQAVLSILDLFSRITQNITDSSANAQFIPDAYKDYFFHHLFLEHKASDGKIARLKDVYIPNYFNLLDFQISNNGVEYKDLIGFIIDFVNGSIGAPKYHIPYSHPLKNVRVLFVKGLPGSGKSSLFYSLAHKKAYDPSFFPDYKFYFVKLIEVYNALNRILSVENPLDDIISFLGQLYEVSKKSVIVLDGLDEICVAKDLNIQAYCNNLIDSATSKQIRVIVTTRLNYINIPYAENKNVLNIRLINLNAKQLRLWCNKYFYIHKSLVSEKECALKNIDYMNNNSDELLVDIFAVPLLFYMITVSRIDISKVKSIGELYDAVFAEMQNRNYDEAEEDSIQKPRISKRIPKELARQIAIEISYRMYEKNKTLLPVKSEDIQKAINMATSLTHRFQETDKNDIEALFPMTFYYKDRIDAVEFAHKSIMEFFAAEKIYQEIFKYDDFDSFINAYIVNPLIISNEVLSFFTYYSHKNTDKPIKDVFPNLLEDFERMITDKNDYSNKNITYSYETALVVFKIYWYFIRNITRESTSQISRMLNKEPIKDYVERVLSIVSSNNVPFLDPQVLPYDFSGVKLNNYMFSFSQLNYSKLDYSEMNDCKFCYSNLSYASLQNLIVVGELSFESCNLSFAQIHYEEKLKRDGTYLNSHVNFIGCNLNNATIHDTDISTSHFESVVSMDLTVLKNVVMTFSQFLFFLRFNLRYEKIIIVPGDGERKIARMFAGLSKTRKTMVLKEYIDNYFKTNPIYDIEHIDSVLDQIELP